MKTEIVRVDRERPDPDAIARAADCLRRGGLVAFPTETVYGLGVHALDRDAVLRLFAAKQRPANDPLIVHVASLDQVAPLVTAVPDAARTLAARFWPGPLTLVMRKTAVVPGEVTAGLDTVAVRVPAHPVAHSLITAAALPIAAPSANLFSRPSPTQAQHVLEDLDGRIDMVVDGGSTHVGVESTVIDLTQDPPVMLRPGAIGLDALRMAGVRAADTRTARVRAAGDVRAVTDDTEPMASPGMLSKHYAPRAPLTLFRGAEGAVTDAIRGAERRASARGQRAGILVTSGDMRDVAARLYASLRELDARGVDLILAAEPAGEDDLTRAVRDRLKRAAAEVVDV